MDNTKKFNNKADKYSSGRPSYPKELIKTLYDMYGFNKSSVIADIGSGTGILTRQLLEMGSEVYAVEPNENMRKKAKAELDVHNVYMKKFIRKIKTGGNYGKYIWICSRIKYRSK